VSELVVWTSIVLRLREPIFTVHSSCRHVNFLSLMASTCQSLRLLRGFAPRCTGASLMLAVFSDAAGLLQRCSAP